MWIAFEYDKWDANGALLDVVSEEPDGRHPDGRFHRVVQRQATLFATREEAMEALEIGQREYEMRDYVDLVDLDTGMIYTVYANPTWQRCDCDEVTL